MPHPSQPQFRFRIDIQVRYSDIDAQRHLNNVAFFSFMEQARVAYVRNLGFWSDDFYSSVGMIVAKAECTYLAPAYLMDTVTVWTRVSHLGNKSFHFEYLLETEQAVIAKGQSVQACFDYSTQQTQTIPDAWKRAIKSFEKNEFEMRIADD